MKINTPQLKLKKLSHNAPSKMWIELKQPQTILATQKPRYNVSNFILACLMSQCRADLWKFASV